MKLVEEYLAKFEKAAVGFSSQDKRVLAQDFYVPLDQYVDFSYAHNGYKDVLEYFKKKAGPPPIKKQKNAQNSDERAAELNISGINMKNQIKLLSNEKSNLNSRPSLFRFCTLYWEQTLEQAFRNYLD